eukprot:COSAG01_NODE_3923_length_5530_cov_16.244338_9_plen_79_part_00
MVACVRACVRACVAWLWRLWRLWRLWWLWRLWRPAPVWGPRPAARLSWQRSALGGWLRWLGQAEPGTHQVFEDTHQHG